MPCAAIDTRVAGVGDGRKYMCVFCLAAGTRLNGSSIAQGGVLVRSAGSGGPPSCPARGKTRDLEGCRAADSSAAAATAATDRHGTALPLLESLTN